MDPFEQVGIASQTLHLGPASHSGLDVVSRLVVRDLLFEIDNEFRPFRPWANQTHLTTKYIPKLR